MKIKHFLLGLLCAFLVWGLSSCKDEEEVVMPVGLSLGTTQTTFEFEALGGEQKIALKSNYPCHAEMSPAADSVWCKLAVTEKELVITPTVNYDTVVRSSKVRIFSGEGENVESLYLDIVQKAGDKMSIVFMPEKVVVAPDDEQKEVMYMTASPEIEWKWKGDTLVDWIEVIQDKENSKLILKPQLNPGLVSRFADLEVSGGIGGNRFTEVLNIEQMGNRPMVKVNPDTVRVGANGEKIDLEILCTLAECNIYNLDWATVEEKEEGGYTLNIAVNPNLAAREGSILVTGTQDTVTVYTNLKIYQEKNVKATISANKSKIGFETAGGSQEVEITSSWETWEAIVSEDAPWCTITKDGNKLKINATASDQENDRFAIITLKTGDGSNTVSSQIAVTQFGTKPSLVLSSDRITLNEQGSEVIVNVATNAELWGCTLPEGEEQKWCKVTPDYANNQIKISADPAEAGSRSVELTVEIPQTDVQVKLTIVQSKFYKVGDVFVVNGEKLGIVYEVSDGGAHGKVFALKAHRDLNIAYRQGLPYDEDHPTDPNNVGVVARSEADGLENMKGYKSIPDWKNHFPIAAYVDNMNDKNGFPGWYLPSIRELLAMVAWIDGTVLCQNGGIDGEPLVEPTEEIKKKRKAINQLIVDNGGNELYFYGYDQSFIIDQTNAWEADYFNSIWSSTETDYQTHPMNFSFYLRNGWWKTHHVYSTEPVYGEIRPFLAF